MPGKAELFLIRAGMVIFFLLMVGLFVGGLIYGPTIRKAWNEATTQKVEATVSQAETQYEQDVATDQARTQAAEIDVTVHLQEQSREILNSPGASDLVDPDLYDSVASGLQRNQSLRVGPEASSDRSSGPVPDTGTAADRP